MNEAAAIRIPFNKPGLTGKELLYIADAITQGHSAGDGRYTQRCSRLLERRMGTERVLLTTSCTHALEMAAILLDVQPGDEVIVPSFTFVSTANAFALRGAKIVFADVREDTLNLDERQLPDLITAKTKAIVPVHYAGVACEMDAILRTAQARGIAVVEDNAHGLFAKYRGRNLGTFGELATQSFHETKNVICGEGGALVLNDARHVERAEILREKGTNRSRFYRGQVDKYTWVDIGSSFLPSDLLAAFLLAQLERYADILTARERVWKHYRHSLARWAAQNGVRLPVVPEHCEQPYHMFYLLLPNEESRQRLIEHLRAAGILSVFHYIPLHNSEMGRRYGGHDGMCPITEDVSRRLLRIPMYNDLDAETQAEVVDAILRFAA
jgi:dTDP-4-amino-4,6-dideoxygalactose transaminase